MLLGLICQAMHVIFVYGGVLHVVRVCFTLRILAVLAGQNVGHWELPTLYVLIRN